MIGAADRAAFYQLKTMLQGVVARGTARAIKSLSPYVAGKTGTTEDAVDGWFVGFTNDVTVAVWVGYDNGDGKRRSLGASETGARVALPIFQPIIEAVWADQVAPKTALSGPSREAQRQLVDLPIDYMTGDRVSGGRGFVEHFRRGPDGRLADTQYQLVSREEADAWRYQATGYGDQGYYGGGTMDNNGRWIGGRSYYPNQGWQQVPPQPPAAPAAPTHGPWPLCALERSQRSAPTGAAARSGLFLGRTFQLNLFNRGDFACGCGTRSCFSACLALPAPPMRRIFASRR